MSSQPTNNLSSNEEVRLVRPAFEEIDDSSNPNTRLLAAGGVRKSLDPTIIPAILDNGYVIPKAVRPSETIKAFEDVRGGFIPPNETRINLPPASDSVNHPKHYTSDPSGIECIEVTRWRNFNVGNAIKYLWRAGLKDDASLDEKGKQIEDLKKAIWYIEDEIKRIDGTM